jgi:PilZ domain
MGILRTYDRRREPRKPDLSLMVGGVDTQGERFLQETHARDISVSGALLSGLNADLKSGDVIGVLYGKKTARYRVIWVRYDEMGDKMQAAVHRLESDACP